MNYLGQRFKFQLPDFEWKPRYNLAPTQEALVVIQESDHREVHKMKWGLIPHWAKDKKMGYQMINARAETLDSKPSFKEGYKKRRCLILADGFYEWKEQGNVKTPMRATLTDGSPFAFAGIWDVWKDPDGSNLESCTIITTEANAVMMQIHDRMPVILPSAAEEIWLDPKLQDSKILNELLKPYPANAMQCYPVSQKVSSWKNDSPDCIERI